MKSGELTIGSRLPTERALAETLGIGRNSTREALSIMHGMGLIERRQVLAIIYQKMSGSP